MADNIYTFAPAEALANVLVGGLALALTGFTKNLPQQMFAISGASQVRI